MDKQRARCRVISYIILFYILAANLAGVAVAFDGVAPTIDIPEVEFVVIEHPMPNQNYEETKDVNADEPTEIVVTEEKEPEAEAVEQKLSYTPIYIPEQDTSITLTEDEIYLIARIAYAEAGNQCDLGVRFVIDTILNRLCDSRFPNTIYEVVCAAGQYDCVSWGTIWMYELNDHFVELVREECLNRTDTNVIYYCSWPCDFSYWATYYTTIQDHNFYI